MSYLKRLPVHGLKIDQSFVRDVSSNPSDAAIVEAIIGMARRFNLSIVAEGVETASQLDYLQSHGTMAYQGYHFSRPIPAEEFAASFLRQKAPV
jgi:EAL domain-containing protein (putative c-di-GMP-specific phosphodiesterase class I)